MTQPLATNDAQELLSRLAQAESGLQFISDSTDLADKCTGMLTRARLELAAGRLVEARDQVLRIEALLMRAEQSRATLRRWGPVIGIYEVVLLGVLLALVLAGPGDLGLKPPLAAPWGMLLLPYCVWGALGGVVAALFGLYIHASQRDFDRGYIAFYFFKPIMGFVLGPLIYLFAQAGPMAVQTGGGGIQRHELLYLGAFVIGFGERFSLRLIDRVAAAIFGSSDGSTMPVTPTPGGGYAPPTAGGVLVTSEQAGIAQVHINGPEASDLSDVSAVLTQDGAEIARRGPGPDEDASFVFTEVPPGMYSVSASKPGWKQTTPVQVGIRPGGEQASAEVILAKED